MTMEKQTQNDRTYQRAVVYYRFARKGHADNEREVADYFAKHPAVPVAASFRETNPSTRPMLREAIDAARRESAAVLVAGEYRKDRTYEVICGTLTREGVPFVWLGSMWSCYFLWQEPEGGDGAAGAAVETVQPTDTPEEEEDLGLLNGRWPRWPQYPGDEVAAAVPWLEFGRLTLAPGRDNHGQGRALAVADWCEEHGLDALAACWRHWEACWPHERNGDFESRMEAEGAVNRMCRELTLMALGRGHLRWMWGSAGQAWVEAGDVLFAVGTEPGLEVCEAVDIAGHVMYVGEVRPGRVVLIDPPAHMLENG
jgi:hypothetical protein